MQVSIVDGTVIPFSKRSLTLRSSRNRGRSLNSVDNLSNALISFDRGNQRVTIMHGSLTPDLKTMECSYHRREER